MERALNVILVEDDAQTCTRFLEHAETIDNLQLLGVSNNSYRALQLVEQYHPDAIILDLELHDGTGSGLQFLQDLKTLDIPFMPYILVTTDNSGHNTYECARQFGADFIMSKHAPNYSELEILTLLSMMKNVIHTNQTSGTSSLTTIETKDQFESRIKKRIYIELEKVGIHPRFTGHKYLIDAIFLIISDQPNNVSVTIAKKYGKTHTSVERAMQNAIDRAWKATDIQELLKHYTAIIRSEKGVPTIIEFISYYGNKIKSGY